MRDASDLGRLTSFPDAGFQPPKYIYIDDTEPQEADDLKYQFKMDLRGQIKEENCFPDA